MKCNELNYWGVWVRSLGQTGNRLIWPADLGSFYLGPLTGDQSTAIQLTEFQFTLTIILWRRRRLATFSEVVRLSAYFFEGLRSKIPATIIPAEIKIGT